jgi:hypothetical protein
MHERYLLLVLAVISYQSYAYALEEPVTVTDFDFLRQSDTDKNPVIQFSLTNNNDVEQSFVQIVQFKDSNSYTVYLDLVKVTLRPFQSIMVKQPLMFETDGAYSASIFVWSSIVEPIPLSYANNTFHINLLSCKGTGMCFEGSVTKIVDGDTLDVDGKRIRLALVNTPERDETGYKEATNFTATLCPVGSSVLVDQDGMQLYDRYDRMIAVVYCDGALLNAELLFANHAVILKSFCKVSEFGNEDWAKRYGC